MINTEKAVKLDKINILSEEMPEDIDSTIFALDEDQKEFIRLRFKKDIDNPNDAREWNVVRKKYLL